MNRLGERHWPFYEAVINGRRDVANCDYNHPGDDIPPRNLASMIRHSVLAKNYSRSDEWPKSASTCGSVKITIFQAISGITGDPVHSRVKVCH
jgi:hypothetical protein